MFVVDWRESPHGQVYVKQQSILIRGIRYEEPHI